MVCRKQVEFGDILKSVVRYIKSIDNTFQKVVVIITAVLLGIVILAGLVCVIAMPFSVTKSTENDDIQTSNRTSNNTEPEDKGGLADDIGAISCGIGMCGFILSVPFLIITLIAILKKRSHEKREGNERLYNERKIQELNSAQEHESRSNYDDAIKIYERYGRSEDFKRCRHLINTENIEKQKVEEKRRLADQQRLFQEQKARDLIQAQNYEIALRYDDAIVIFEKYDHWEDAGRCRKLQQGKPVEIPTEY